MAKGRRDADRRAGRGRPPSERPGKTCPVCGRPNALDKEWHQIKAEEAEELRTAAREPIEAREEVQRATAAARALTMFTGPVGFALTNSIWIFCPSATAVRP